MLPPTSAVRTGLPVAGYHVFTATPDNRENPMKGDTMLVTPPSQPPDPAVRARLQEKAVELEAAFLSEMLAHTGLDRGLSQSVEGGETDPFASFLREQEALQIARRGGIGLSEAIFRSMLREEDGNGRG